MEKIILAYCRENTDLAQEIDEKLGRVGIPFEHVTNQPGAMPGQFTAWVQSTGAPVILLITDNFLKSQNCMASALTMLQQLVRTNRVLPVVADGKIDRAGNGQIEIVPTQFERVIHAIQYMNYWQSAYMDIRAQNENGGDTTTDERVKIIRDIAAEIGEFLNLLRDSEYIDTERFKTNDYEAFFRKFGIYEWHEQYKKLAALDEIDSLIGASTYTEPARFDPQVVNYPQEPLEEQFIPNLMEDEKPAQEAPATSTKKSIYVSPEFQGIDALIEEIIREEEAIHAHKVFDAPDVAETHATPSKVEELFLGIDNPPPAPPLPETEPFFSEPAADQPFIAEKQTANVWSEPTDSIVPQPTNVPNFTEQPKPALNEDEILLTIKDANFWLEKGYTERAMKVFEVALEEYPNNQQLQHAFIMALTKSGQHEEATRRVENLLLTGTPEAKLYDLLGSIALAKSDFAGAKLCWDKTSSLDPTYPNIYLKLGVLMDEHFKGHKKAAAEYLKIAAEQDPENVTIHALLSKIYLEHLDRPKKAIKYLLNCIALQQNNAEAWFDLATAYKETHDHERAKTCYLKSVEYKPSIQSELNDRLFIIDEVEPMLVKKALKKEVLTVMITGATSGIGRATANVFAEHGHRVILVGRREDRLEEMVAQFEKDYKNEVLTISFDVRNYKAVQQGIESIPEEWQNIDLLLNNAGLAKGLDFIHEGNLDHWETMIDTNIKGLLYVTRLVSPGMVKRRKGHIINISSSAGKEVYPKGNVYCATKHAVEALTRAMRMDLYTHNIRVSEVSPGHVEETEFALNRFDGNTEKAKIYEDFQPLKSSDVAEVIYFIATRPAHVNIQDVWMFGTQQASATLVDRTGRNH